MSIESAKALYSRLMADEEFLTQFERANSQAERLQMLQAAGYEFTLEEWKAAIALIHTSNPPGSEVNDLDLRSINGGKSTPEATSENSSIFKNIVDLLNYC